MNISACLKDFYFMNGKECLQPEGAGLSFITKSGELYNLRMHDDDIGFHMGMSYHILSAGLIKAHGHAVYLPSINGLARGSQAFFFSPSPKTEIRPPMDCNIKEGIAEDADRIPKAIGLSNWEPNMKYTDWNEAIVRGFKKVFFNE